MDDIENEALHSILQSPLFDINNEREKTIWIHTIYFEISMSV